MPFFWHWTAGTSSPWCCEEGSEHAISPPQMSLEERKWRRMAFLQVLAVDAGSLAWKIWCACSFGMNCRESTLTCGVCTEDVLRIDKKEKKKKGNTSPARKSFLSWGSFAFILITLWRIYSQVGRGQLQHPSASRLHFQKCLQWSHFPMCTILFRHQFAFQGSLSLSPRAPLFS